MIKIKEKLNAAMQNPFSTGIKALFALAIIVVVFMYSTATTYSCAYEKQSSVYSPVYLMKVTDYKMWVSYDFGYGPRTSGLMSTETIDNTEVSVSRTRDEVFIAATVNNKPVFLYKDGDARYNITQCTKQ
ncbi:hypothetical protein AB2B46_15255 [Kluyvera intermedia]|uniref:hypothetical protein n=1 Tax=Kluyvera intermedia TaxID=61648 RepID=UPI0034A4B01F